MRKKKIISSAIIGNIVEYYDFGIYAVFAEIIAKLFFPPMNSFVQLMLSFTVFAIGFFMRPIGGILFGHVGDKLGRKIALIISIVGMATATFCIGILPSYAEIGISATVFLVLIRIFQGLCIGGEGAGSAVFIIEHFKEGNTAFMGSIVMTSNMIGTLLATFIGIIINYIFTINDFTWRYGFLLGGFMGFIGLYLRLNTLETPVFQDIKNKKQIVKLPIINVLKERSSSILIIASLAGVATSSAYMIRGFLKSYFSEIIHYPQNHSLYLVSFALICLIILLPLFGILTDKFGHKKIIYIACYMLIIFIVPIFIMIGNKTHNIFVVILGLFFISCFAAAISAPVYPYAVTLFTPELRYSGVTLSWNLGNALFGGTTPLISTFLVKNFNYYSCAYYLIFTTTIFLIVNYFIKDKSSK